MTYEDHRRGVLISGRKRSQNHTQTQYYIIYRLDIMRELDLAKSEEIELAGAPAV